MRDNETLQLIENFVSKAEDVLQSKVSQINSLQNKVNLLNAKDDGETPESANSDSSKSEETNSKNIYATFKSSQMIKEHIEQHLKEMEKENSKRTIPAEKIAMVI